MKIRHIKIEQFRGIREQDWRVGGNFVCLVRPGDSTKTTILDAVEFALSPRWNIPFDDSDFYDGVTDQPVVITVTVGDLPEEFKSDAKYGYLARGWTADGSRLDSGDSESFWKGERSWDVEAPHEAIRHPAHHLRFCYEIQCAVGRGCQFVVGKKGCL